MIWLVLVGQMVTLWLLWGIRRSLGVRSRVRLPGRSVSPEVRDAFPGAVPPNRYVVVRWPMGRLEYQGCIGAHARQKYEDTHPAAGEEVEFWELGDRRGYKAG